MRWSEDVKPIVSNDSVQINDINNLVKSSKIMPAQWFDCGTCRKQIYYSDKIEEYSATIDGFSELLITKVVPEVWDVCNTGTVNFEYAGEDMVAVVLKLKGKPNTDYVVLVMFASEYSS